MKVLVTGGTGAIGRHVVPAAAQLAREREDHDGQQEGQSAPPGPGWA
jgi:uncharacterized protein YbjT (DUF2867 family)